MDDRSTGEQCKRQAREPRRRVLVVDDEERFRRALVKQLCFLGCSVHEADNGKDALEALRKKSPAVVFLDGHLPGMKGMKILKAMKKIRPEIRVVLFTSQGAGAGSIRHVFQLLQKPCALNDLSDTLEAALQASAASRGEKKGFLSWLLGLLRGTERTGEGGRERDREE